MRKKVQKGTSYEWHDSKIAEPSAIIHIPEAIIDQLAHEKLLQLPTRIPCVEITAFMLSSSIYEKGMRPYYPYMLMLIDSNSGMIIGNELMAPLPDLDSMWQQLPAHIINFLNKLACLPAQILSDSIFLHELLADFFAGVNIPFQHKKKLAASADARKSILKFMTRE
jgi:hypothetical protein